VTRNSGTIFTGKVGVSTPVCPLHIRYLSLVLEYTTTSPIQCEQQQQHITCIAYRLAAPLAKHYDFIPWRLSSPHCPRTVDSPYVYHTKIQQSCCRNDEHDKHQKFVNHIAHHLWIFFSICTVGKRSTVGLGYKCCGQWEVHDPRSHTYTEHIVRESTKRNRRLPTRDWITACTHQQAKFKLFCLISHLWASSLFEEK
jgi:hypothetical protein